VAVWLQFFVFPTRPPIGIQGGGSPLVSPEQKNPPTCPLPDIFQGGGYLFFWARYGGFAAWLARVFDKVSIY